jgi:hypothetical protein
MQSRYLVKKGFHDANVMDHHENSKKVFFSAGMRSNLCHCSHMLPVHRFLPLLLPLLLPSNMPKAHFSSKCAPPPLVAGDETPAYACKSTKINSLESTTRGKRILHRLYETTSSVSSMISSTISSTSSTSPSASLAATPAASTGSS